MIWLRWMTHPTEPVQLILRNGPNSLSALLSGAPYRSRLYSSRCRGGTGPLATARMTVLTRLLFFASMLRAPTACLTSRSVLHCLAAPHLPELHSPQDNPKRCSAHALTSMQIIMARLSPVALLPLFPLRRRRSSAMPGPPTHTR